MLPSMQLLFFNESVANKKVVAHDAHHLQYASFVRCYLLIYIGLINLSYIQTRYFSLPHVKTQRITIFSMLIHYHAPNPIYTIPRPPPKPTSTGPPRFPHASAQVLDISSAIAG